MLNITSETRKGEQQIYQQVYPVGDLVMPIPNFVASPRMGLAGALHDAMGDAVGTSSGFGTANTPLAMVAGKNGQQNSSSLNPAVLANNCAPRLPSGNQPDELRTGRCRRREQRGLRYADRPDHTDRFARNMGPQRRTKAVLPPHRRT